MDKIKAIKQILLDIEKCVDIQNNIPFYIGKTANLSQRSDQHEDEGLGLTFRLAIGSPKIISKVEEELIRRVKDMYGNLVINEGIVSSGSDVADTIYISFKEYSSKDALGEQYDYIFGTSLYPVQLSED